MKSEVQQQLKEKGYSTLFTEKRYKLIKELMAHAVSKDRMLKSYLAISPDFKVDFICDHMIKNFSLDFLKP